MATKTRPSYHTVVARYSEPVALVFLHERKRYSSGLIDATLADRAALTFTLLYLRRSCRGNPERAAYFGLRSAS